MTGCSDAFPFKLSSDGFPSTRDYTRNPIRSERSISFAQDTKILRRSEVPVALSDSQQPIRGYHLQRLNNRNFDRSCSET